MYTELSDRKYIVIIPSTLNMLIFDYSVDSLIMYKEKL